MSNFQHVLVSTFAGCALLLFVSWWFYLPWFMRLMKKRHPSGYAQLGGWSFFSSSKAFDLCVFFLRRNYKSSSDVAVQRHGEILRWVFCFPLLLGTLALLLALATEAALD